MTSLINLVKYLVGSIVYDKSGRLEPDWSKNARPTFFVIKDYILYNREFIAEKWQNKYYRQPTI